MSFNTGMFRLAKVVRWVGGLVAAVALAIAAVALAGNSDKGAVPAAVFGIAGIVVFGIAWAIAYVLEGFAKE